MVGKTKKVIDIYPKLAIIELMTYVINRKEVKTMPRRDGTGPNKIGGGGLGRQPRAGAGKGGAGTGGFCVCPNCGNKTPHQAGHPCYEIKCSQCGTAMVRA